MKSQERPRCTSAKTSATVIRVPLKVGLGMWLLRPAPQITTLKATATSRGQSANPVFPTRAGTSNIARLHGTPAPPFDWRQVESEDYRQYVANLRALGCPEQTVRDI